MKCGVEVEGQVICMSVFEKMRETWTGTGTGIEDGFRIMIENVIGIETMTDPENGIMIIDVMIVRGIVTLIKVEIKNVIKYTIVIGKRTLTQIGTKIEAWKGLKIMKEMMLKVQMKS